MEAPKMRDLYAVALLVALVVGLIVAFAMGLWRHEPHPDPVRGSPALLMAVVAMLGAFVLVAGILVIARWFLWPQARTWMWHSQAIIFALLGACVVILSTVAYVSSGLSQRTQVGWVDVEDEPLPQGSRPAYFPASHQRFEWYDESVYGLRFWEVAVEGSVVRQRAGFDGSRGDVSMKTCATPAEAAAEVQDLIKRMRSNGYRAAPVAPN